METSLVTRLGHLGDGVLENGGFAPFTLPGETVAAGDPARIVAPSAERRAPLCPVFTRCGGCALQHASEGFVQNWKMDVAQRALAAHGLSADFRPVITSPLKSRRRAVFAARRTKKSVEIGFHARRSDKIEPIMGCVVLRDDIVEFASNLEPLIRAGVSRKGVLRVGVTRSEAGMDVDVADGKPLARPLQEELAELAQRLDLARLSWNGETVTLARPPSQSFDGVAVVPPPGAFLQATKPGEAALFAAVKEVVSGARGAIVDLFSGCGTFALPLAKTHDVHAVEGEAVQLEALEAGWRHGTGLRRVSVEVRDLFRRPLLSDELRHFSAAVIDPPRAGAEAQARQLAQSGVTRIAMVSCNPVTFAKDASILVEAGFHLDWVQVIDQFRFSPHIELAACLTRR